MASGLNKVMIIGNLGRDPEIKYLASGTPVTSFKVAVNRNWKTPEGETREETEWFNVVAYNKLAETCGEWLSKGRKVYVEGRLHTRSYETPDGQKKYWTEVVANTMLLLDSKPRTEGIGEEEMAEEASLDDIPF